MIQDSGDRREFESGAVRDITEGKGRCDLLPLDVIARLDSEGYDFKLDAINKYVHEGNTDFLAEAIRMFSNGHFGNLHTAMLEVSKHYEEGCNKYGERNWEKGIPLHCYIDSAIRHYLKFLRGDEDERHDRAFLWNFLGAMWTHKHKPELIDLPFIEEVTKDDEV